VGEGQGLLRFSSNGPPCINQPPLDLTSSPSRLHSGHSSHGFLPLMLSTSAFADMWASCHSCT
jgi:hypothetical protein